MMRRDDWSRGEIDQRFTDFSEKHIAGRAAKLQQASSIPSDLWTDMRTAGLFGIGLPEPFGGQGYDMAALLAAGRALVESGGNLGVALSWLIHEMTARYLILPFGRPEQHYAWLPELAAGRQTACFAVSEPDAGAHPKLLKTTAEKTGDHYILNGAKTYLTNGPMADLFIVIAITDAITDNQGGRNRFSAFILPRNTPGLTVSEPMPIDFLRPAPHGSISLKDCRVPEQQLLGPAGDAWESIVPGFREIEDTLMAGPILGGLAYALSCVCDATELTESVKEEIFDAHVDLCGLWTIAQKTALMLEKGENATGRGDLSLYFRQHAEAALTHIGRIAEQNGLRSENRFAAMAADLAAMFKIGTSAVSARKRKRCAQWFERN